MTAKEKVYQTLDSLGIEYKVIDHERVCTIEEMDNLGIFTDGEVCKNLFLRNANGKIHYLVSILKDKHPDIQGELKPQLNSSRLSFGSDERLAKYLGLKSGAVSPFGIINDENHEVKVVLDSDLKTVDGLLGFHPNDNTSTVWLAFDGLIKYIEHFGNEVMYIDLAGNEVNA
ncbi:MAG: prolyl-tRNA synthetase associated domain-containing protein [Faecalibacterium sp.]|nr:prolyl-tRNA synthetase associated domain-containing protein [Ruminococcus sp.]MCM1392635.1 prolyl-tRNA synthetase associated domain-containing protein [Ruminococcus sp.]MCM1486058.1 prolyl-tRNA synthetase associated domain-containing protein [Faecalibacterium sp.]